MGVEVRLREVRDEDFEVLYENQLDPESNAMAGVEPRDREGFLAHRARIEADPETITRVIVVDGVDLAGDIGSWRTKEGVREVGYRIGKEFWGRDRDRRAGSVRRRAARPAAVRARGPAQ